MAFYRKVSMNFWTDGKVVDDFSPDERYCYLYILTNPHTNLCGCYEISMKQIAYETGLDLKKVRELISRLERVHDVIRYFEETKELLILHWSEYNWTSSEKFRTPLAREIETVKCIEFATFLAELFKGNDTVSIGYEYHTDITVTVTVIDTVIDTDTDISNSIKEIIDYLNEICGTRYKPDSKETKKLVSRLLKEGFTVEDFKTVIYKKAKQWKDNPKMCKYLRPQTLFSNKFEGYLNEQEALTFEERLAMA